MDSYKISVGEWDGQAEIVVWHYRNGILVEGFVVEDWTLALDWIFG